MFSSKTYYSHLKTLRFGKPCIYLDLTDSTINVASEQPSGTLVVAGSQTKGKGQRGNVWQSPVGCAMASLKLVCLKSCFLGKRITFLQHVIGLSALRALEEIDRERLGCSSIKLKWPNDIIYINPLDKARFKIGGILVNSEDRGNIFDIVLSFGLNVLNPEPTICISKIIPTKTVSTEQIIALIMNHLEEYTSDFDESKFNLIKKEYSDRCLHMNDLVEDETHGLVRVKDTNDDGYLIGERLLDNKLCTVLKIMK